MADSVSDYMSAPNAPHSVLEPVVTAALAYGVFSTARQLRAALGRLQHQDMALEAARGELAQVIQTQFDVWELTPAERDVGLLALKGLDVAEIAEVRGAAQGTVRTQLARIYAKAGISGRAQFAAWFVEDLLD